jgi:hypothetical protein
MEYLNIVPVNFVSDNSYEQKSVTINIFFDLICVYK